MDDRVIKLGAIAGLSSVILVMMLGQTRVFWTMSRDGLLPGFISRVHPRFKTPWVITIATGIVVAFFGAVLPVRDAGNLCNIGTLLAFVIVSIGVLVLRVREPELPRKFRTPWVWVVAPMGAMTSFGLMLFFAAGDVGAPRRVVRGRHGGLSHLRHAPQQAGAASDCAKQHPDAPQVTPTVPLSVFGGSRPPED